MTSIDLHDLVRTLETRGVTLEPKPDGGVRLNAPRPLERELLEAIKANKAALLKMMTTPRLAQTPTNPAILEPHSIWQAMHAAIPDCLEMIRRDGHLIAWLEYRTPSKFWVSTPPIKADCATLKKLVLTIATRNQDALNVALKSAEELNPDINPARQEVAQRARFSRKEVSA